MAFKIPDGSQETTTTDTTGGPYTLDGAVAGFESFIAEMDALDHAIFLVRNDDDYEIFIGVLTDATTLTKPSGNLKTSTGTSDIVWGGGATTKNVIGVAPGQTFFDMMNRSTTNTAVGVGVMSRGPTPDEFDFHTLSVTPAGPMTIGNGNAQLAGDIVITQTNVADLSAAETVVGDWVFTGADTTFNNEIIAANPNTVFSNAGTSHIFQRDVAGTDKFLSWSEIGGGVDDYRLKVYVGTVAENVLTNADLPISGLTEGQIPVAAAGGLTYTAVSTGAPILIGTPTVISTDSSVDVILPAGWSRFMVTIADLLMTNTGDSLGMRIAIDGPTTPTFLTTSTYNTMVAWDTHGNQGRKGSDTNNQIMLNDVAEGIKATVEPYYAQLNIVNPGDPLSFVCNFTANHVAALGGQANRMAFLTGAADEAGTSRVTNLEFREQGGSTLKSGTIKLFGFLV